MKKSLNYEAKKLTEAAENFCDFISRLPAYVLLPREWGPKEILAHLVYHHELYVRLAEAQVSGKIKIPPQGRFRDLNAVAVAASQRVEVNELLDRLRAANHRLLKLYKKFDPEKIHFAIKHGSKEWTLEALVPRIGGHIRAHLSKLRKEFDSNTTARSIHEERVM